MNSLLVLLWVISGIVAFVWSIVCFWKTGNLAQKLGGLILSIIFGPFALIYIVLMQQYTDYCH